MHWLMLFLLICFILFIIFMLDKSIRTNKGYKKGPKYKKIFDIPDRNDRCRVNTKIETNKEEKDSNKEIILFDDLYINKSSEEIYFNEFDNNTDLGGFSGGDSGGGGSSSDYWKTHFREFFFLFLFKKFIFIIHPIFFLSAKFCNFIFIIKDSFYWFFKKNSILTSFKKY